MKSFGVLIITALSLIWITAQAGTYSCSCSADDGSCSCSAGTPTPCPSGKPYAYCNCDNNTCLCFCSAKKPTIPKGASLAKHYPATWSEVASVLARDIHKQGDFTHYLSTIEQFGLSRELMEFQSPMLSQGRLTVNWRGGDVLDFLRQVAQVSGGSVTVCDLPIIAYPVHREPGQRVGSLHCREMKASLLFILVWSMYGERFDFLMDPSVSEKEISLDIRGFTLDELQQAITAKLLD